MSNIRQFREEPNLLNKIGMALAYILLAWLVVTFDPGNLLSIFMLLGFLVYLFVVRQRHFKYFIRYHLTQAMLLNIAITAILFLLLALIGLLATLPGIEIIARLIQAALFVPMNVGNALEASAKDILVMAIGIVMAFYCLRGQYTELPYVTDGVRHWI